MADDIKRVALITGAAGGIGREVARRFLERGMAVAIADIQKELGEATVAGLSSMGGCAFFHVDLTDNEQVDALVPAVVARFGRIDVLVNNAGIPNCSPIGNVTHEEYDRMFGIHLKSGFFLSQAASVYMKQQHYGRIVNISSPRAICPDAEHPLYGIAKSAVRTMTEFLAFGLARWNIRANCVSPALIFTPMTEHYRTNPSGKVAKYTPSGCYQEVSAIVDVIDYLVSDASSAVNGQTIEADMGMRYVNMLNLDQFEKLGYPGSLNEK